MYGNLSKNVYEFICEIAESEMTNDRQAVAWLLEEASMSKPLWKSQPDHYQWWDEYYEVYQFGDKLIAIPCATTSGDMSAEERGWNLNFDDIYFVTPRLVTTMVYD